MSSTKATYQGLAFSETVALGAQRGLDECQKQFRWNVWNCPQSVFTQIFSKNNPMPPTKETAFVHAVISAGIVHTVTKNCSKGQFEKCRCDPTKTGKADSTDPNTRGKFRWGGCSDDIEFGINLAKSFLDERETGHDAKALVNLHNNNVGRMVCQKKSYYTSSIFLKPLLLFTGRQKHDGNNMQVSWCFRKVSLLAVFLPKVHISIIHF